MSILDKKIKTAFDEIRAEQELKTATKYFIYEKHNEATANQKSSLIRRSLVTAFSLFAVIICSAVFIYSLPVTAISVDTEKSSFELEANLFNKIIKVTSFDDSEFETERLKHLNYKEAVNLILTQEDSATLTVSCKDSDTSEKIIEEIRQCKTDNNPEPHCVEGNHNFSQEAHKHGISNGKYNAYLNLRQYEPDITIDEIKNLTMKQINERINAHLEDVSATDNNIENSTSHGHDKEHKNGNHHGKQE